MAGQESQRSCSVPRIDDEQVFATAYHYALLYAVRHRDELVDLGFDSTELDKQIADAG